MQTVLGQMRRAVTDYNMIEQGDRIAVGVSGGKDSLALLMGLARLREFYDKEFFLTAITLDPGFSSGPADYTQVADICREYDIPFVLKQTDIGEIVFDIRKEANPCSLCSRMRRGALHDLTVLHGCNKIALGHHKDDAVETFMMNLFNEGRVGCFSPVTYLSRKNITMIRPLVYSEERDIKHAIKASGVSIVKSPCPIDGKTDRQNTKEFLINLDRSHRGIKNRIFGAMQRGDVSGWQIKSSV